MRFIAGTHKKERKGQNGQGTNSSAEMVYLNGGGEQVDSHKARSRGQILHRFETLKSSISDIDANRKNGNIGQIFWRERMRRESSKEFIEHSNEQRMSIERGWLSRK